jgi:hypothetical protein
MAVPVSLRSDSFLLDLLQALARGLVLLLGERLPLDLELHDPALDLVDLCRQRVDLDAHAAGAPRPSGRSPCQAGERSAM